MKMYRISIWAFCGICALILALPVSRHWKLLASGVRTRGVVVDYVQYVYTYSTGDRVLRNASAIWFPAGDSMLVLYGPEDMVMEPGREVTVWYDPEEPSRNCLATFSGFYLSTYTILPMVLLIIWAAFYLSYSYYWKRSRSREIDIRHPTG
jgi:hypothetical protein